MARLLDDDYSSESQLKQAMYCFLYICELQFAAVAVPLTNMNTKTTAANSTTDM